MKFGKLADINRVDFTLPEDHPQTAVTLRRFQSEQLLRASTPRVYVGSARWGEKDLVGKIYPVRASPKEYLYYYSRQFSTIELNTTHYRIPTPELVQQWREKTDPNFLFCPKVPQVISHHADFGASARATDQWLQGIAAFGKQLGISFMQLPPHFTPQHGRSLFDYLQDWPPEIPLAVEFRHPEWFANSRVRDRAFDLLEELNVSPVITDTAGRRDVIHQRLTSDQVFIRFVGNRLDDTDYRRVDDWVLRLQRWLATGLQVVYFIVHQPEEHFCVDLSVYVVEQLNRVCQLDLTPPRPLPVSVQQSLF